MNDRGKMKTKDNGRKWMWMFLAALALLQTYLVWELLAVFALFAVGFAAIASVVGSLYMLHRLGQWQWSGLPIAGTRSWWPRGRLSIPSKRRLGVRFAVRAPRQRAS
jgi:hypothetical protein